MCDTFVALAEASADGHALLAKNSDRHPNEAQEVVIHEAQDHPPDARARCSYIDIAQVRHTYKTILCKPFWLWGAEMGVNEHGLAVGNESAFTKGGGSREAGLIGLDLVRLALERGRSADEALELVTSIVENNPMGGNAGYGFDLYCDHALILADASKAWHLEVSGKHWIAKRVSRARAISNRFSIRGAGDRRSENLIPHAIRSGWCASASEFDFAPNYSDFLYSTFAAGAHRQERTAAALREAPIDLERCFRALRDHGGHPDWTPQKGITGAQVCMHAGPGPVRISQTTGSLVCHFRGKTPLLWLTATSTPCTAIYKPVWLDSGLPDMGPRLRGSNDPQTLWWRHEAFQREIQRDYADSMAKFRDQRDALESDFIRRAYAAINAPLEERAAITELCFREASEALEQWSSTVASPRSSKRPLRPSLHALAWKRINRASGL